MKKLLLIILLLNSSVYIQAQNKYDDYVNTNETSILIDCWDNLNELRMYMSPSDIVIKFESILMEQLVLEINERLKNGNKLIMKYIVNDISIIRKEHKVYMSLTSKYKIE